MKITINIIFTKDEYETWKKDIELYDPEGAYDLTPKDYMEELFEEISDEHLEYITFQNCKFSMIE